MPPVDLYVIAAGKGSRLNLNVPKALVRISDEPCLTLNLRKIGHKFRRVFVVTNIHIEEQWKEYFESLSITDPDLAKLTVNLPIESGLGDGHATLQGVRAAERVDDGNLCHDIVITWGDVLFPSGELIDEIVSSALKGSGLLPAMREENPYVSLLVDDSMRCISADFSKFGEHQPSGYHDQSVFRFDLVQIRRSLRALHNALWKNGRYIAPSGELSLLYSFHYLYNASTPAYVYETKYPTLSFNTIEEVAAIRRRFVDGE